MDPAVGSHSREAAAVLSLNTDVPAPRSPRLHGSNSRHHSSATQEVVPAEKKVNEERLVKRKAVSRESSLRIPDTSDRLGPHMGCEGSPFTKRQW